MKKALKIIGMLLGMVLLLIVLGAAYFNVKGIPSYENKAPELTVNVDSAGIAEGARMASMMCANCHRSEDGKLGGMHMDDTKEFGFIHSTNITQHPEYGIADYTDGELAYLLRTGIKKDGSYAPPWMIKFPNLSDEDLHNIIGFLRSDHPMVQPSDNNPPPCEPNLLAKVLCNVAFGPLPYPDKPIPPPDRNDKVAFGKYMATAKYDCYACHSADFKTMDIMVPENTPGLFWRRQSGVGQGGQPQPIGQPHHGQGNGIGQLDRSAIHSSGKDGDCAERAGPDLSNGALPGDDR